MHRKMCEELKTSFLFITGVVQVLASGCTPLIAGRLGKKLILLISAAGMCLSLVSSVLSIYLTRTIVILIYTNFRELWDYTFT